MSTAIQHLDLNRVPTVAELFEDNLEVAFKNEQLNLLLNTEPPAQWVKEHPFIKNHKYLPIDKVELLLKKIFKKYRIEILREGVSFNAVYVVVRVWYYNPLTSEMDYHDGIGAQQLQTATGTSAADLANINNGAVAMAFPIAKTVAIKDACDHFGKLFGADLNRKNATKYTVDKSIVDKMQKKDHTSERMALLIQDCTTVEQLKAIETQVPDNLLDFYTAKLDELNGQRK